MATPEISPQTAQRRRGEFQTIDVRAEHEFRGPLGRVPGSRLLPLPELEARAKEVPAGVPLAPEAVGLPLARMTRESVEALLARVEEGFRGGAAPPDLDLTLVSLRRSLSRL